MSIVIPFAPRPKPAQGVPEASRKPAQILFFTGVRYERQPESAHLEHAHVEPVHAGFPPRARRRPTRATARATIAGHQV